MLHKIFNRNTVKISYPCMPNIKQKIDGHDRSILFKSNKLKVTNATAEIRRIPTPRPMPYEIGGIYQATVTQS